MNDMVTDAPTLQTMIDFAVEAFGVDLNKTLSWPRTEGHGIWTFRVWAAREEPVSITFEPPGNWWLKIGDSKHYCRSQREVLDTIGVYTVMEA